MFTGNRFASVTDFFVPLALKVYIVLMILAVAACLGLGGGPRDRARLEARHLAHAASPVRDAFAIAPFEH